MIPATFTLTALLVATILAAAGAPLVVLYIVGGIAMLWQLAVALAAGAAPPAFDPVEISEDPAEGVPLDNGGG